jgi:thymidine kinase
MDFISVLPSIDIIIGPMFSGKTTELHRRINICVDAGYKVVYINSNTDTRADDLSTHNTTLKKSEKITYLKTVNLVDVIDECKKADIIGIDEAQFFPDLITFSKTMCESFMKKVIVSGLNGDFKREPFGQIISLITLCDTITKLNPFCMVCRKEHFTMTPALFSKRLVKSDSVVLVGGNSEYIPVCRKCFATV